MNRQWWYVTPPKGKLSTDHFQLREVPVPDLEPGRVLVRHRYLSLMPGNRAWMQRPTYRSVLDPGQVMPGRTLGEVIASDAPGFAPGDVVEGGAGWQDYAVVSPRSLTKRPGGQPQEHLVGLLGTSGLTAYFGFLHVGRPRAGQTVLVSAAAGGIGSIVVQLARISGCRVVGVAGGPEKCAWLRQDVGVDATVDYKAGDLAGQLKTACPQGVDLFFDNTGGPVLEAALDAMKIGGRIVCCGNTAQYDGEAPAAGPKGLPLTLNVKSLTMQGFIVSNYLDRFGEAEANLWGWRQAGQLKPFYHLVEGLEQTPAALVGLLNGANRGMTIVRI